MEQKSTKNEDLIQLLELRDRLRTYVWRKCLLSVMAGLTMFGILGFCIINMNITEEYKLIRFIVILVFGVGGILLWLWSVLNITALTYPLITYAVLKDNTLKKFLMKDERTYFEVDYQITHYIDTELDKRYGNEH